MDFIHAVILGAVEGVTEFLPVSSTGHLTIVEKLFGYQIDGAGITAFTAIIQLGSIMAAVIYFRRDIIRVVKAWTKGLFNSGERGFDYNFGWYIILGSLPIAFFGLVFKHQIETVFRSLWFVVGGLILWSAVMWYADKVATEKRHEHSTSWRDTLVIGFAQVLALVPGVSRSGATMSVGLLRGMDRLTATRLSFFLGIPALIAAGLLETVTQAKNISQGVGWSATITATIVAFIVGYASIAWLIKYISHHNFSVFVWYRVILGGIIVSLLLTNIIGAV